MILTKLTIIIIITFEIYRHLRSQEKDLLVNPGLVYDNVVHFAQTIKAIGWKGPVVFMTDCTKIRAKVMYAHELGQIVGSVLDDQDTQVSSYEDIHEIMETIKEKKAVASQVRGFLLKVRARNFAYYYSY